ncbi:ATP-binding cassette domain-containing protein [Methylomarinum sp. Ch1-1]|uniref:ATP-binding cassette domain-containing protein n=1 Tax=Methylomarinum roseum TaxID=3067653 RepID=A0AAU7NZC2_9GAMM|nr:ATP-binding cassette domain-containing protein [Methylomarinum sp. Ch1-1]MDP4521946.1 ATP-binding cassette domain-containing protein [Methylomarinum sp. Ch1-1]
MNTSLRTVFHYLQDELEIGVEQADLSRLLIDDDDSAVALKTAAEQFGMRVTEAVLTLDDALAVCGRAMPLLTELGPEQWLILSGFSRGRIEAVLIEGSRIDAQFYRVKEIAHLLKPYQGAARRWFLLEPAEPLAAAKSHDHEDALPPLHRLFGLLRGERHDLLLVLLFSLGTGLLYLATPIAVQALVNTVALGGMLQPLTVLAFILFVFLAFGGVIYVLQTYLVELIQRRIFIGVSADLAQRLPRVDSEVYDRHNGAELVNRFFDVVTIQKAGATLLLSGLSTVLQAVVGLLVLAAYHPLLLVFDIVLTGLIAFILFVLGRKAVTTAIEESKAKYALAAWLETVARNMLTFKSAGGPEFAYQRSDELAHAYLANRKRHYRVVLRQTIGAVTLHAVAGTSLLAIGGLLVIEGQLTLGQLVAAELIVSGVLASFAKFGKQLEGVYDLMAGVDKLGHLLDLPLERSGGEKIDNDTAVELKVTDLVFSYHSKHALIDGLSFILPAGQNLAILCPSGGGKTTLADLLGGLRLPKGGRIELNGVDLSDLSLQSLRRQVAIVNRREVIEDSIIENIRLGRAEIDNAQIREVLDELGLLRELMRLPEGLQTEITAGGSPLASSQLSRLLIARALVGRPVLLVVDGILDDLDEASREQIYQVLFKPERNCSLLMLTRFREVARRCQRLIEWPTGARR